MLCIGTKEGEPNDTSRDYISGNIITVGDYLSNSDFLSMKATAEYLGGLVEKFPHLFKPLPWWYGRTVEEMPRYVNTNSVYGIRKVKEWAFIKGEKLDRWRVEDTRGEIYSTFHLDITPADESEYQEYQKQKQ